MINYEFLLPEILFVGAISIIIVIDLFLTEKYKHLSYYFIQLLYIYKVKT